MFAEINIMESATDRSRSRKENILGFATIAFRNISFHEILENCVSVTVCRSLVSDFDRNLQRDNNRNAL
jgi:hypothetical protein